ncbi:hypothetical protein EXIGLDRAFT_704441 [Exidia glandulosa HHB12029]|uniref:Uncharacterized protein n=1 Tax=Exidia glandulosa HHB12029 TaxID=1314781 RepID=A0A165BP03_EXIGL|nr:hypothetical protein EXIGLDRAFT_704441 [Exidia glandulosa HHB12029]
MTSTRPELTRATALAERFSDLSGEIYALWMEKKVQTSDIETLTRLTGNVRRMLSTIADTVGAEPPSGPMSQSAMARCENREMVIKKIVAYVESLRDNAAGHAILWLPILSHRPSGEILNLTLETKTKPTDAQLEGLREMDRLVDDLVEGINAVLEEATTESMSKEAMAECETRERCIAKIVTLMVLIRDEVATWEKLMSIGHDRVATAILEHEI